MTPGYWITIMGMFFVIGGLFVIGTGRTHSALNWGALTSFCGVVIMILGGFIVISESHEREPQAPQAVVAPPQTTAGSQTNFTCECKCLAPLQNKLK